MKLERRKLWRLGVAAILQLTMTVAAQEVQPALPSGDATETLRLETSIVNMIFTVRDRGGRLVKQLGRDFFRVTDEARPQAITHFAEEANQPLSLVVLLDKSTSVSGQFDFERRATTNFVRSILRPGKDEAVLIAFDKEPRVAAAFAGDAEDFVQGIGELKAEGGTALFDAASAAIEEHLSAAGPKRRALVLVTDGDDTVSWTTQSEVLFLALSNNVVIYTLGVKPEGPGNHKAARRNLERLGEETGGLALFPKDNPEELAELFSRVEDELRHQYSLGYPLPPAGGKAFHKVEIRPLQDQYRVRSRSGYYTSFAVAPDPAEVSQ